MSKKTTIARKNWDNYVSMLRKLSDKAESELNDFLLDGHTVEEQIDYAYALVTKYGEGAAELACQMHEALANISNVLIPPAEPAPTATYYETAKAIRGTMLRTNDAKAISASAGRLVKLAGVDTMMKNALRDGCEWAWIPSGDTCPFCIMLASNGWQKASKKAIKNGHAEHIHNNCDCAYVVRFSDDVEVEGYNNGKEYLDMYKKQKGIDKSIIDDLVKKGYDLNTPKGRMAAMRRQHYANNRDYINAQKRAAYARKAEKELPDSEGVFETVSIGKTPNNRGYTLVARSAHTYPDNEGMFENNPLQRADGKQTDIIKPRNIMKEMNRSEAGKNALNYINENKVPVYLFYNVDVPKTRMGEYDPVSKCIYIYVSNTKSTKETALTVIHEAAHSRLGGEKTRRAEVLCQLEEIKHLKRSNTLTVSEIKDTIKAVNRHKGYSKLPWR